MFTMGILSLGGAAADRVHTTPTTVHDGALSPR